MTYYGGQQLANSFRTVRQNTLKIAEEIPEDKYGFQAAPGTKTIGQLLAHIALGHRFQRHAHGEKLTTLNGFNFGAFMQTVGTEEQHHRTKADIIALLGREGDAFAAWLERLPEEFLREEVEMPTGAVPARKTRFEMLLSPKEHEMHHRGQLMLMQRMIGMTPHLTRQMQERIAARAAAANAAR
jgi:uncharacterized damage-inducible protein DinB